MAMYSAVQGPMPGSFMSRLTISVGSIPGSRSISPRKTTRARLRRLSARAVGRPRVVSVVCERRQEIRAVGVRRFKPGSGVSMDSPNRSAKRPASVVRREP